MCANFSVRQKEKVFSRQMTVSEEEAVGDRLRLALLRASPKNLKYKKRVEQPKWAFLSVF